MKKHEPVLAQLFKILNSYLPLPAGYYEYLTEHLQPQYYANDTPLYEQGELVKKAWFLSSGFGMAYFYKDSGDKQVARLHAPGALIGGKSFLDQTPSAEYLMACRDSYWMSLTHGEVDEIYALFPGVIEQTRLIMAGRELDELAYKKLLGNEALVKVAEFYKMYPALSQPGRIIVDADISSFLMISQRTLRACRAKLKLTNG